MYRGTQATLASIKQLYWIIGGRAPVKSYVLRRVPSHMSGKWEVIVKSLKFRLRRTVRDTVLTYKKTSTLLAQIEAILNSRPLEPLSDNPDNTAMLTPVHFLIGTALNAVPGPSLLDVSTNRLSRWQLIQQRVQQFWHLCDTQVDSLVLLTNERLPPGKWRMVRVLKKIPGQDGLTRVVSVRTATTTLTRPIAKLALLPVTPQGNSSSTALLMAGENV
ncbi:uncharacterized protein [Neodiprion pinetum]|uniref:uncharacterized protein n=1 Tax=Neodiprion pinetum TaxID=441929 RepID=UPI001EE0E4FA|nr:uncharacterized protein LOC124217256 [Neodiprion pinetum]